ncbi:endonuclease [Glaciecola sp. MH2013]|uniref:HNH endonuclease signature motif containing protein n=1 Tax=Glaciecola sp. MH2013 TaxID=2785524 RepID=UPI00189EFED6|nr:endonuclease [Glaciecola sp. MH2013]MBF7071815.1 endonuclease [Glaciecola sp. MH2013]
MIKIGSLLLGLIAVSFSAHADIENANFESWSGNSPDGWTTIDSGISVARSTSQVQSGNSSALIRVNTASQASTDFRQSIDGVAGQAIDVSVWIRHTEGNVRARLYVAGYRGYSNNSLRNQWQQLSYRYTPSSSGPISIGLRFYDTSGFDGSEIVYVDNFKPEATIAPPPVGCTANEGNFSLLTDNYGAETSWKITDAQASVVASGSGFASNTSYSEALCLEDGDYTLTINDSYGDGICCSYGTGSYSLTFNSQTLASGGAFGRVESTNFTLSSGSGGSGNTGAYYASTDGLSSYALKTELFNIIKGHATQGYGALWGFYSSYETDTYYENDGSILDIYSERPSSNDPYTFTPVSNQCGNYQGEGGCYNREHSFPRSWFGGAIEPMNSDVHHIFASDGFVNSKRSSFPYGEVSSATFTSLNGSKVGSARSGLGYSGTVFEPIDEFKGDLARAYFYMATRYQDQIGTWQSNSSSANAVLNGSSNQVFESWFLNMLKAWHQADPVSQKERDRNEAAQTYQGNRNPYIDRPEFVTEIWGN